MGVRRFTCSTEFRSLKTRHFRNSMYLMSWKPDRFYLKRCLHVLYRLYQKMAAFGSVEVVEQTRFPEKTTFYANFPFREI